MGLQLSRNSSAAVRSTIQYSVTMDFISVALDRVGNPSSHENAGWALGWVSALDSQGRTIWIVDAHRDDGKHFVVRADEKLTPFLELESAIRACGESS